MSSSSILLLLLLLLVLPLGLCVVAIIAVSRARPEDVPAVLSTFVAAVCRVVDRLPRVRQALDRRDTDQVGQADNATGDGDRKETP